MSGPSRGAAAPSCTPGQCALRTARHTALVISGPLSASRHKALGDQRRPGAPGSDPAPSWAGGSGRTLSGPTVSCTPRSPPAEPALPPSNRSSPTQQTHTEPPAPLCAPRLGRALLTAPGLCSPRRYAQPPAHPHRRHGRAHGAPQSQRQPQAVPGVRGEPSAPSTPTRPGPGPPAQRAFSPQSIDPGQQFTWEHSNLEVNKPKNRYANVIAYDHSRVILQPIEGSVHKAGLLPPVLAPRQRRGPRRPGSGTAQGHWRL